MCLVLIMYDDLMIWCIWYWNYELHRYINARLGVNYWREKSDTGKKVAPRGSSPHKL